MSTVNFSNSFSMLLSYLVFSILMINLLYNIISQQPLLSIRTTVRCRIRTRFTRCPPEPDALPVSQRLSKMFTYVVCSDWMCVSCPRVRALGLLEQFKTNLKTKTYYVCKSTLYTSVHCNRGLRIQDPCQDPYAYFKF